MIQIQQYIQGFSLDFLASCRIVFFRLSLNLFSFFIVFTLFGKEFQSAIAEQANVFVHILGLQKLLALALVVILFSFSFSCWKFADKVTCLCCTQCIARTHVQRTHVMHVRTQLHANARICTHANQSTKALLLIELQWTSLHVCICVHLRAIACVHA